MARNWTPRPLGSRWNRRGLALEIHIHVPILDHGRRSFDLIGPRILVLILSVLGRLDHRGLGHREWRDQTILAPRHLGLYE